MDAIKTRLHAVEIGEQDAVQVLDLDAEGRLERGDRILAAAIGVHIGGELLAPRGIGQEIVRQEPRLGVESVFEFTAGLTVFRPPAVAQQVGIGQAPLSCVHQRIDSPGKGHADNGLVALDLGGRIEFGEAFNEPVRIGLAAVVKHEVVGVFVKQNRLAGIFVLALDALRRTNIAVFVQADRELALGAALVIAGDVFARRRPGLAQVAERIDEVDRQLRCRLVVVLGDAVEAVEDVSVLFEPHQVGRSGFGADVAIDREMGRFRLDPGFRARRRRHGRSQHGRQYPTCNLPDHRFAPQPRGQLNSAFNSRKRYRKPPG